MDARQQLIYTGQYLISNQLAWGTSGNMSARIDENRMVITASGTYMANLSMEDFVEYQIGTGEKESKRKASKETPMHLGIYREREDVNAILHSSPFYITLFACSNEPILSELFIETMYYLETIAYVDYHHPGSQELADAVSEKAQNANIIMMRNHGVVVCDDSVPEAQMRLETLEMACRMILKAKKSEVQLSVIPEKTVQSFLEDSFYKPRKRLVGKSTNRS
ncbi:class II aldolase/adducin family protein [Sporosarcina sp. ACRSM]|uniref:class II aldolase/adducin family protein n=1 Tax=Sporosarcina sp. ACRSM TaxID=2918216 RepID=UPI001EF6736C|nr:class II aldolase/adducin family protein [Sporosarcina sp. ACRSM]MCG7334736.1 class II aldolase/adducin family protein [Sporosarcina sp. ACRSM]